MQALYTLLSKPVKKTPTGDLKKKYCKIDYQSIIVNMFELIKAFTGKLQNLESGGFVKNAIENARKNGLDSSSFTFKINKP